MLGIEVLVEGVNPDIEYVQSVDLVQNCFMVTWGTLVLWLFTDWMAIA